MPPLIPQVLTALLISVTAGQIWHNIFCRHLLFLYYEILSQLSYTYANLLCLKCLIYIWSLETYEFCFPIYREKNIFSEKVQLDFIIVKTHHRSGSLNYSNTFLPLFMIKHCTDYSASKRSTLYSTLWSWECLPFFSIQSYRINIINIAESTMTMERKN